MKKIGCLLVAVLVLMAPAISQARGSRTATGEYNTVIIEPDPDSPNASGQLTNGVKFKPRKGERFVSFVIEDRSGFPARAIVGQDVDGDGVADLETEFCGETQKPIRFRKGVDIVVAVQEGVCQDQTMAIATLGTITATFTR